MSEIFRLKSVATGSRARAGVLRTRRSEIHTPVFMPVGTLATVRGIPKQSLIDLKFSIILGNTYHLILKPGLEVFERLGGIHQFVGWPESILTDSGGYQVFSLASKCEITEKAAIFKDAHSGRIIRCSPEFSIQAQQIIGSDIMMAMDHLVASTSDHATTRAAMERTHRWARRSLAARTNPEQLLFGIVQGACFKDLRQESAAALSDLQVEGRGFDGLAIGGLAVGESKAEREDFCEITTALLPTDKPRYLMGVGTPIDLLEAVHRGVDMFDCIIPTAYAQRGVAFTNFGKVHFRRAIYKYDQSPLDPTCPCVCCQQYSRAYLFHLTKAKEVLAWYLLGIHNLTYYKRFMETLRQSIIENTFLDFYHKYKPIVGELDLHNR